MQTLQHGSVFREFKAKCKLLKIWVPLAMVLIPDACHKKVGGEGEYKDVNRFV